MNDKTKLEIRNALERAHKAKYPSRYGQPTEPGMEQIDPVFDELHEAVRLLIPNEFADARATMAEEFKDKSPGSVYRTYTANIFCLLIDQFKFNPDLADELATKLMYSIFEQ